MLTVNIRDLSRSPKKIFEEVKKTKQKQQGSALALLKINQMAEQLKAKGPKDLSTNLDKYTWDE